MKILNKKTQGFTLMEVMVSVAIVGIIAAIAAPNYAEYVKDSRRTEATTELMRLSQLQESYYAENLSYARRFNGAAATGGLGFPAVSVPSENGYYLVTMVSLPAGCNGRPGATACTAYALTATRAGVQATDTQCGNFTLSNTGLRANISNTLTTQQCWR